ncbi:MAG: LLM class flavin-dependent oxidoreductase [Alphaproteobacteria bacterium]
MDFGIFNLTQHRDRGQTSKEVIDTALEETVHADRLDFGRAWFVEHHFSNYSICGSPLTLAAVAAAKTERIRLGTAVIVAPLHSPTRLLSDIGLADAISGGRLDVGLGSGYQRFEFERLGMELDENKERFHEILDILELGLKQPAFEYRGKHYDIPRTAISVKPVQRPSPPIWIAGYDPVAHRRCARAGYHPFVAARFSTSAQLEQERRSLDSLYREEGVDPETMQLGLLSFCHVTDSKEEARRYADSARFQHRISLALRYRRELVTEDFWVDEVPFEGETSLDDLMAAIPVGDAHTVAERLVERIRGVRPAHIALYCQVGDMPKPLVMRSMERLMTEVVPLIEKACGAPLAQINEPKPRAEAAE